MGSTSVEKLSPGMSALAGLGIDNLHVEVDAPEIPILDGSSGPFVFLLQSAGIEEQPAAKKFLRVTKAVEYREGDKWVRLEPYDGFRLTFSIVFDHPAIDATSTSVTIDFAEHSYVRDVARAERCIAIVSPRHGPGHLLRRPRAAPARGRSPIRRWK